MRPWARKHGALLAAAALCTVTASCGLGHGPSFTIGFRRVALDLSYKDEALAKPSNPQQTVTPQPVLATSPFVTFQLPSAKVSLPPLPHVLDCPTAGPDQHPPDPVTVFSTVAPQPGTYLQHNTGRFSLGTGVSAVFTMPKHTLFQIRNVVRSHVEDQVNGPTEVNTWDVVVPGINGSTTTTYQTTFSPAPVVSTVEQSLNVAHAPAGELDLVHLVIVAGSTTVDFRPQPPVTIMAFKNGTGTSWNSAGIDQRDGTSMVVRGSIAKRVNVDLCGKVYDTYEVVSNEQIANLRTGLTSRTDPNDPNVYDIATQYGALFLHQHIATTTTFPTDSGTTTIVSNYDQTLDSREPVG